MLETRLLAAEESRSMPDYDEDLAAVRDTLLDCGVADAQPAAIVQLSSVWAATVRSWRGRIGHEEYTWRCP